MLWRVGFSSPLIAARIVPRRPEVEERAHATLRLRGCSSGSLRCFALVLAGAAEPTDFGPRRCAAFFGTSGVAADGWMLCHLPLAFFAPRRDEVGMLVFRP